MSCSLRLAVVLLQPHNSQTYGTGKYQIRHTAYKKLLLKMEHLMENKI